MRHPNTIIASLLTISLLSGCGLQSVFDMSKRDTSQNQLCQRLKRDMVFHSADKNHDAAWSSPAKEADMLRQYRDNDCAAVLSGAADAKSSESTPFSMPRGKNSDQNHIHVQ